MTSSLGGNVDGRFSGMNEGGVVSLMLSTDDDDFAAFRAAGRLPFSSPAMLLLLSKPVEGLSTSITLSFLPGSSSLLDRSFPAEVGGVFADRGVVGLDDSADCVNVDWSSTSTRTVVSIPRWPYNQSSDTSITHLSSVSIHYSPLHLRHSPSLCHSALLKKAAT